MLDWAAIYLRPATTGLSYFLLLFCFFGISHISIFTLSVEHDFVFFSNYKAQVQCLQCHCSFFDTRSDYFAANFICNTLMNLYRSELFNSEAISSALRVP